MGDMIKFGIKLAMSIATAIALVASIAILFSLIASNLSGIASVSSAIWDIFALISLFFPINLRGLFTIITSLFAFKIAYWAADKMIQFIDAAG